MCKDFPGGPVVKKPPVNTGHTSSIPGLGRPPPLWGQLSPCTTAAEPAGCNY